MSDLMTRLAELQATYEAGKLSKEDYKQLGEMFDPDGNSIFGRIEQTVAPHS